MLGAELFEICESLHHDAGARKVMVFDADGAVLAHAGEPGVLDEAAGDALATLVGDVIAGAAAGQFPPAEDLVAVLPMALQVCAAPVGTQAALVVVFEKSASLDRVRAKMRRARTMLEKSLPTESGPTAS
jgi:predicted regulator of Ras-like GTPase activity (Roadblock/LC7/MglB family)